MSVFSFKSRETWVAEVFPNGRPTELPYRDYLKDSAIDWSVSRKRLLEIAIRSADEEQAKMVLSEYAYLVGIDGAMRVFMQIWGNMVAREMDMNNDEPLDLD